MDGTRAAHERPVPAAESDHPTELIGIGEFGRRTRLSAKALRIYDELGLVRPARVDPRSGYRWYRPDQADRARVVALLRRLDMPLARISRVVDAAAESAAAEVGTYWAEVEARTGERRALARCLRGLLLGGKPMTFDIAVREVPSRSLFTVTRHVAGTEVLGRFLGEALTSFRAAAPAATVDWPHNCPFVVCTTAKSARTATAPSNCRDRSAIRTRRRRPSRRRKQAVPYQAVRYRAMPDQAVPDQAVSPAPRRSAGSRGRRSASSRPTARPGSG
ncbi:MAG: MerR family transcriptional regulator [Frankia sp.]